LIPLDILREIVDEPAEIGQDISESISDNISHIISLKPSEGSELESKNHSIPSEVEKYHAMLLHLDAERWNELYPYLKQIGLTHTAVAKAFGVQRDKGMAAVQTFQKALLKCEFEAQLIVENNHQILDKKGSPVKSPASFYQHSLSNYGDYRNPDGWMDPELARSRELIHLAEQIKAAREEGSQKLFDEWKARLNQEQRTRLLIYQKKIIKGLDMVKDETALKMVFDANAELIVRTMQNDLFAAIPPQLLPEDPAI